MRQTTRFLKIALSAFLLVVGSGPPAWGAPPAAKATQGEFPSLLAAALATNPNVSAATAQLEAAREYYRQGLAGLLPDVEFTATATTSHTNWHGGDNGDDPEQVALTLTQPLFNLPALTAYRSAPPYIAAYEHDLESARQGVLLAVIDSGIEILQNQEVAKLATDNLKVTRQQLATVTARVEVGELTLTDQSQASARVAAAQAELIQATAGITTAQAKFVEAAGTPPPTALAIPAVEPLQLAAVELPVRIAQNPAILAASERLTVAQLNVKMKREGHLPTVTLSAGVSHTWDSSMYSAAGEVDNASATVALNLPIYTGGETASQVRQAQAELKAQQATLDQLRQQTRRTVEELQARIAALEASSTALEAAEQAATRAVNGMEVEFRVGTRTALDLLDAQLERFRVQTDRARNHHSLLLARYQLLHALGGLRVTQE